MRPRIACGFLGLLVALGGFKSLPAQSQNVNANLSGLAVVALANAYDHLRLGTDQDAPLRLQPYLVVMWNWGAQIQVNFGVEGTQKFHVAFVDARTGSIVAPNRDQYFVDSAYLPGMIAGEIIAVYRHALSDKWVTLDGQSKLRSGAFSISFTPGWSTTVVAFYARSGGSADKGSLFPAPTPSPSPGYRCFGACNGIFASYVIDAINGQVTIKHQAGL